jgi:hypothetical protein
MSNRNERLRTKRESNRKTTPLGIEQLEARLMNAVSGIEQNLQLLLTPGLLGSTQIVSLSSSGGTNAAPTIQTPTSSLVGTEVRGQSASLSVLGADDQGESKLVYTWTADATPSGGNVTFSINGTNESKRSTVGFTKAGNYVLRAIVRDESGRTTTSILKLNVVQTLTSMQLTTSNGNPIDPARSQVVSGTGFNAFVRGIDQFGNSMTVAPRISWTQVSGPSESKTTPVVGTISTTLNFNRAGDYVLRANSGSLSTDLRVRVSQVQSSIGVRNSENRFLTSNTPVSTTLTSQRWTAVALDQFGSVMAIQPSIAWSAPTVPNGASPNLQPNGNALSVSLNKVGSYTFRAQSGSQSYVVALNVNAVLNQLSFLTSNGSLIDSNTSIQVSGTNQRLTVRGMDQFGKVLSTLPTLTWTATKSPVQGTVTSSINAGVANIAFNRSGDYEVRVRGGNGSATAQFQVAQTLTQFVGFGTNGVALNWKDPVSVSGVSSALTFQGLDQFGRTMNTKPALVWSTLSSPTSGNATVSLQGNGTNVAFDRAGNYTLRASSGNVAFNLPFRVLQTLNSLALTSGSSGTASLQPGATQQYVAQGKDQFDQPMASVSAIQWSATGGTISASGMFSAGSKSGDFLVTAKSGGKTASIAVNVAGSNPQSVFGDASIGNLVNSYYADSSITRPEMIGILKSAGSDGIVNQTELNDLRFLVANDSGFNMPSYVRELARDVVNANPANLKFKGASAGNLAAGSSSILLNNLVDKWFLGADEPILVGAGITYQNATGNLFNGSPSHANAKQGYLGDCYFIAAITSIADAGADAVRNMFIDNGDGTFTVRFFAGAADYVTVNRRLPTLSNGRLAYSGLGDLVSSATTTLWVALAEKAYAQWNETGNAGRDGLNSYASIEGGWMSNVNRQVLGTNSSNYAFSNSSKQTLINAFGSGRAVTLGTNSNASAGGLVGGHAYIVTAYNAANDTFSLYNPWGTSHPSALSWDQLRANCYMFSVANSAGTIPISSMSVHSSLTNVMTGNWTTEVAHGSAADGRIDADSKALNPSESLATIDAIALEVERVNDEWITVGDTDAHESKESESLLGQLSELRALAVDAAFSQGIESILG